MARNAYTPALTGGTKQSDRIPGRPEQVENNAGGMVFGISPIQRLDRFLILGAEGGTYYATEAQHVNQNLDAVIGIVKDLGPAAVARIRVVSAERLAPKNTPSILALAVAIKHGDDATRGAAYAGIADVCRTGTHLFELAGFLSDMGKGWSRGLRTGFKRALLSKSPADLAYHAIKYRQRYGWTYGDLLRLTHPTRGDYRAYSPDGAEFDQYRPVFDFMCGRTVDPDDPNCPAVLAAHLRVNGDDAKPAGVSIVVKGQRLPWESIPDRLRAEDSVMEALVDVMPVTATVRNLASLTRRGLLAPMQPMTKTVVDRLTDQAAIQRSGAHPMLFLDALATYNRGGVLGRSRAAEYEPNQAVSAALDKAFRSAFGNVKPAGKRTYVALDVSGSMVQLLGGSAVLSCREAAAAQALVTVATEPAVHVAGFTDGMRRLKINASSSVAEAIGATVGMKFQPTDCSVPMLDALAKGMDVDTFVVITDNETWSGTMHPAEALAQYRKALVPDARLVVVAMTATPFSIADPTDAGMLDVVGFSTDTPNVIASFSRRDF